MKEDVPPGEFSVKTAIADYERTYTAELKEANDKAEKMKKDGDMYGWNFFQGMAHGMINRDIIAHNLKARVRQLEAYSAEVLVWTKEKPTAPGWYWCQNKGDRPGETWEAVVRVDRIGHYLCCSWLTSPNSAGIMHEKDWSEETLWAGPIPPPSSDARDENDVKKVHRIVTLTGRQLRDALELAAPDSGDAEQLDTELTIVWREAWTSNEGDKMPEGYYAYYAEYPEEGSFGPLGTKVTEGTERTA